MESANKWLILAANIGVIAGIVFLGYELQQNNELLEAEARATRVGLRQADTTLVIENPELGEAILKYQNDEPLSERENQLMEKYIDFILVNFQSVYREMSEGLIEEETVPLAGWRTAFGSDGKPREYWRSNGQMLFDPDFVEWMNENVVNFSE